MPHPIPDPEDIIALVKRKRAESGMSLSAMAKQAGLHFNSLNRIDDPAWRPRLDTLRKLMAWINAGKPVEPLSELPMSGHGWEIAHDADGWWLVTEQGAKGPYHSIRSAVADATK